MECEAAVPDQSTTGRYRIPSIRWTGSGYAINMICSAELQCPSCMCCGVQERYRRGVQDRYRLSTGRPLNHLLTHAILVRVACGSNIPTLQTFASTNQNRGQHLDLSKLCVEMLHVQILNARVQNAMPTYPDIAEVRTGYIPACCISVHSKCFLTFVIRHSFCANATSLLGHVFPAHSFSLTLHSPL